MTIDLTRMTGEEFRAYYDTLNDAARKVALAEMTRIRRARLEDHERRAAEPEPDPVTGWRPQARHLRSVAPDERAPTPDPVPITETHQDPPWPTAWLPPPVRDWVEAVSATYAVPTVLPIAVAMTAAATLLQGKVTLKVKDGWTEQLSLWWLVSAPSTARKSPVLAAGYAPIRAIEERLALQAKRESAVARMRLEHARATIGALRRACPVADRDGTKPEVLCPDAYQEGDMALELPDNSPAGQLRACEDLIMRLEQERDADHEPGIATAPKWIHSDFNAASFEKLLSANYQADGHARITVAEAEGTWIDNTLGAHTGKVEITSYLKGYSGETIEKVRRNPVGKDLVASHIGAAHLSLCCCVQPAVLDRLLQEDQLSERGFLGRCIVSIADTPMPAPEYDTPGVPPAVQDAYAAWLHRLHDLGTTTLDLTAAMAPGSPVRALYDEVRVKVAREGESAAAWQLRTVGRVLRLLAICRLSSDPTIADPARGFVGFVGLSGGGTGVATGAHDIREVDQINLLIHLLYYQALSSASLREPAGGLPNRTLTTDPLRLLRWALRTRQPDNPTTRQLNSRDAQRYLEWSSERVRKAMVELAESGHLVPDDEARWDAVLRARRGVLRGTLVPLSGNPVDPVSD